MSASLVAKLRGVITPLFIVLCLSFCYLVVPFLAEKNFDVMNKAQAAEKVSAIADQGDDILLASYFESNENTRTHLYT
ncbi:MAG: hypothetical protein LBM13_00555, partial [Candidatus Ancillula sp.]|nr:hypothetical protein [Candidatus Ancillula sp.]